MRNKLILTGMVFCLSFGALTGCGKMSYVIKNAAMSQEETEKEEQELDAFEDVTVELECADVTIKRGDAYHLSISRTDNYELSAKVTDKKLAIHSKGEVPEKGRYSATVTITVPKDAAMNKVNINLAVGDFLAKKIAASKLDATLATGDFRVNGCDFSDATVEVSVGDVRFEDSGSLDDTTYDLSADVGDIVVDGKEKDSPFKKGKGAKTVKVETSVGDIRIE